MTAMTEVTAVHYAVQYNKTLARNAKKWVDTNRPIPVHYWGSPTPSPERPIEARLIVEHIERGGNGVCHVYGRLHAGSSSGQVCISIYSGYNSALMRFL